MAIKLTPEEENFKKILEYFAKHMKHLCEKKNSEQENKKKKKKEKEQKKKKEIKTDENLESAKTQFEKITFPDGAPNFDGPLDDDILNRINEGTFIISGQGYIENNKIQGQMEDAIGGLDNNSFDCPIKGKQKICISVDATSGYKAGSYLHLMTIDRSPEEPKSTNINPLFVLEKEENDTKTYKFYGLAVGPSQNDPTYVFPPLKYTFDELGLGIDLSRVSESQKYKLQSFFKYSIEMRKQELMGSLTYRGMNQLIATHNMILTGAPGTGKTWSAKNIASWMICEIPYEELTDKKHLGDLTYQTKNKEFEKRCKIVQFHPSYDYTDFVEGLRPTTDDKKDNKAEAEGTENEKANDANVGQQVGFKRVDGVFKEFCEEALKEWDNCHQKIASLFEKKYIKKDKIDKVYNAITKDNNKDNYIFIKDVKLDDCFDSKESEGLNNAKKVIEKATKKFAKKFVFIIDEINRGELSKIFGELFYSIDPGYRGEDGKVFTQYQNMVPNDDTFGKNNGGFFVPENVYIIGTMNDIDRSVESMDFAMRRRFSFIEVKANERMDMWSGEKDKKWADLAKACMEAINQKIEDLPGLSSAYHIGPAYFKKLNDYMKQQGDDYPDFFKLWDNHLYGVIFEYIRGKKDTESTMIKIQDEYLDALVRAVNSRLNVSDKDAWGYKLRERLWEKANSIDASISVNNQNEEETKNNIQAYLENINITSIKLSELFKQEETKSSIPSELLKLNNQIKYVMDIGTRIDNKIKELEAEAAKKKAEKEDLGSETERKRKKRGRPKTAEKN